MVEEPIVRVIIELFVQRNLKMHRNRKSRNRISFFGPKHYILTSDNNVKYIFMNLYSKQCSWVLDTGASLSAIRSNSLSERIPVHRDPIVINGIGGKTYSEGYVYLSLRASDGSVYEHKFYLFDDLPCKSDGIIGLDFLNNFNSTISLEKNILILTNKKQSILPLYTVPRLSSEHFKYQHDAKLFITYSYSQMCKEIVWLSRKK